MTSPVLRPRLLSFPPRLTVTGAFATVEQDSDAQISELLAQAMTTNLGERAQVPTYGVADPAFRGFELGALQRHVSDYGPKVDIQAASTMPDAEGTEQVSISWEHVSVSGGGW